MEVPLRALAALTLVLFACNEPPAPPAPPGTFQSTGAVVVTADGQPITQEMVDALARRIPPQQMEQLKNDPAKMKELVTQVAIGDVLYRRAIEQKLHEKPEMIASLAMSQRDALAGELIRKIGDDASTDEAIKAQYEKQAVRFNRPAVKLQHMLVKEKPVAEEVVASLKAGGDFASLKAAKSLDGAQSDGEVGWMERGRMMPTIEEQVFAAAKGDVVGPVESEQGYHVLKIVDTRTATPLEEVKDQLAEQVKREAVDNYIGEVHQAMKLEWPGEAKPATETPADPAAGGAPPADGAAAAPH